MSEKNRWSHIERRYWSQIAEHWIGVAPSIRSIGSPAELSLDRIQNLYPDQTVKDPRLPDQPGLRMLCLAESFVLFAKSDNLKSASEKLAAVGLPTAAMFMAYHSAYLAARSMLWLLGAPLADIAGKACSLELFPVDIRPSKLRRNGQYIPDSYVIRADKKFDQRAVWDCLHKVLDKTNFKGANVDVDFAIRMRKISEELITPPRNHLLYKASHWIYEDLVVDQQIDRLELSDPVEASDRAFLLWLCFTTHSLTRVLLENLASQSPLIEDFLDRARYRLEHGQPTQSLYLAFSEETWPEAHAA